MNEAQPPHDIKDLLPVSVNPWPSLILAVFLVFLLFLLGTYCWRLWRRHRKKTAVRNPIQELRDELRFLEVELISKQLFSDIEKRELYRRLWDFFRSVVSQKLSIAAQHMTRGELLEHLEKRAPVSQERLQAMGTFFSRAEAAIFSDTVVDEASLQSDLRLVKTMFETWFAEESEGRIK